MDDKINRSLIEKLSLYAHDLALPINVREACDDAVSFIRQHTAAPGFDLDREQAKAVLDAAGVKYAS